MTAAPNVRQSVAVADPDLPDNVIKPNADGSLNVSTTGGGSVQLAAGEAFVGTTGGAMSGPVYVNPTIAGSSHAAGVCIGGIMTFAGLARANGKTGYITAGMCFTKVANTAEIDLFVFNASPSASTTTDNTAFVLDPADSTKLLGVIPITNWYAGNPAAVGFNDVCRIPVAGEAATSLYVVAVARGAIAFATTTGFTAALTQDQN